MFYLFVKRFFDVIASGVVLVLLSPFFIIIIILLKIYDEGEVFYLQERIGF